MTEFSALLERERYTDCTIEHSFRSHVGRKSFTAKEILRVLFSSKIKPIGV
jgi:hypothetical protein